MTKYFFLSLAGVLILNGCASSNKDTAQNDLPDPVTDYPYDVASTDSYDTSNDYPPVDTTDVTTMNDMGNDTSTDTDSVPSTMDYKVKAGDSLWRIANQNNTTVAKLKKINHLSSDRIKIGQILQVPQ
ncbi:MAG: LysM peptidoglycan-binding domain-containing protein [Verrucomicrobiia bacterium]